MCIEETGGVCLKYRNAQPDGPVAFAAFCGRSGMAGEYQIGRSTVSLEEAKAEASDGWPSWNACPFVNTALEGQCIAVSRSASGAWASTVDANRIAAEEKSLRLCGEYGSGCQVREMICTELDD